MKFYLMSLLKIISGLFLTVLVVSCQNTEDIPLFSLKSVSQGLKLDLSSSLSNIEQVKSVDIHWGDGDFSSLSVAEFGSFNKRHQYNLPGRYKIVVDALNTTEILVSDSIIVDLNYLETSFTNINENVYKKNDREILILTLNLHTYQESDQSQKLKMLSDVISKLDIDFVAFQECAQNRNAPLYIGNLKKDNMALKIIQNLDKDYNKKYSITWDWAHYGWQQYEEGVCIISKHDLLDTDQKIISTSTSVDNITSRKAIYGSYKVQKTRFNILSAHTHWRTSLEDEEQNNQVKAIKEMAAEKNEPDLDAVTFICGDFNGNPTSEFPYSEGYNTMVRDGKYSDTFLDMNPDANTIPPISKYFTVGGSLPGRIDYIFKNKSDRIKVKASQILFTNQVIGLVSDHFGVITKIEVVE